MKNIIYLFLYNLGRILSYVFLGFLVSFGSIKFGAFISNIKYISGIFSVAIAILMAFIGLKLIFGKSIGRHRLFKPSLRRYHIYNKCFIKHKKHFFTIFNRGF